MNTDDSNLIFDFPKGAKIHMELGETAEGIRVSNRPTPTVVADVLREAIIKGVLKSGVQLRQDALAAEFGVSRIPVREALRRLEAEGLVTIHPNRGAFVSEVTGEQVQEVYEIRTFLELPALRLAIAHMSEAVLRQAEEILRTMSNEADTFRWIDLDREFHSVLFGPAKKPRLLDLINTLRRNVDRYMNHYISIPSNRLDAQREHGAILEACRRGDENAAVRALEEHLEQVAKRIATYLQTEARSGLVLMRESAARSSRKLG